MSETRTEQPATSEAGGHVSDAGPSGPEPGETGPAESAGDHASGQEPGGQQRGTESGTGGGSAGAVEPGEAGPAQPEASAADMEDGSRQGTAPETPPAGEAAQADSVAEAAAEPSGDPSGEAPAEPGELGPAEPVTDASGEAVTGAAESGTQADTGKTGESEPAAEPGESGPADDSGAFGEGGESIEGGGAGELSEPGEPGESGPAEPEISADGEGETAAETSPESDPDNAIAEPGESGPGEPEIDGDGHEPEENDESEGDGEPEIGEDPDTEAQGDEEEPAGHRAPTDGSEAEESRPEAGESTQGQPEGDDDQAASSSGDAGSLGEGTADQVSEDAAAEAASQSVGDMTTAADPVNVATGEVVLAQTDVTLPGILPLTVERVHRSSMSSGRWFGRTWVSSFDQRLTVTGDRVIGVFADGRILTWPRPGADDGVNANEAAPVQPVAGPSWPLRRHSGGSYSVTDPQRGLLWRFERHPGYWYGGDGDGDGEFPVAMVSDRAGHQVTYGYDEAGRPVDVTHSGGYRIRVDLHDDQVTGLALSGGGDEPELALMGYAYDENGHLASVVNSSGEPLRFSYDQAGRLTGWQDRNNRSYQYSYDDQGRCAHGEGPAGTLSGTFSYDPGARVTRWTDSAGAVTAYQISESCHVTAITDPLGNVTGWEHDERGRLTGRTDPLGRVTRFGYDERGNLIAVTRPDGSQARASYDDRSLPVRLTEPGGGVWEQEFGPHGGRTRLTAPDGSTVRYGHDGDGHLTSVTDASGAVTLVTCDGAGLPVSVTGPGSGQTRYLRDRSGRIIQVTAPDGSVTRLAWTPEGQLASRTFPDGSTEHCDYDGEGNLTSHLTPAGGLTRYEYGPFDRLTAVTAPDGTRTAFGYDRELRLTSVVHGGLTWRYEHDAVGRLVAETDYNDATTRYAYDPAGQLVWRANACGQEILFAYDQLGNPTEQSADGMVTTFGYDADGAIVHARNPDADLRLERDALGRVTAETCNGRTARFEYDAAGRITSRVTPSGMATHWDYDPAGRPSLMTAGGHQIGFGYDSAGHETRRELPGGLTLTQDWDQRGRLTAQALTRPGGGWPGSSGGLLQRRAYSYRADGFVTGIDDLLAGPRSFSLDQDGRITAVTGPGWAEQYGYDLAGNLTHASWPAPPPGPATAWLDADLQGARQVAGTTVTRAGNVRYRYDRAGRVVMRQRVRISRKPDTWRYEWDADSRLTAVTTPDGSTWRYSYDPFGRRISKRHITPDQRLLERADFTWQGAVLAEQDSADSSPGQQHVTTWDYRPGTFTPLSQAEHTTLRDAPQDQIDQQFYAIITDLTGTPAELTAPDGTLAGYQQHTLWGLTLWHPDHAQTPLRFPGQYEDAETGLHYNHHRYYDPVTGSYLTPDPLGLTPAPNPHTYVPNPQMLTDPLGLMADDCGSAAEDTGSALRFTQTTASATFRNGLFADRTIGDIAAGLRSGAIKTGELPVDLISRGGNQLIMNTRSSVALMRGGVSPADWITNDVTGDPFFEQVLDKRLAKNGLTDAGTDVIRITGAGRWASWLG